MSELTCQRCGYKWKYRGEKSYNPMIPSYTSCPMCRANVKVI